MVEDEVRWRRSKGVFMNRFFFLFRNSEGAMRGHQFVAFREIVNFSNTKFILGNTNE